MSVSTATKVSSAIAVPRAGANKNALRLGAWRLESLLGEAALTRVYRARYAETPEQGRGSYAIKVLRQRWHDSAPAVARMRREALVGRCVANRNVVSVLTAHVHEPPYYLVMPCLEGITVAALLAPGEKMRLPYALWIIRQAAEALDALHTAGYLHGDLKPSNLFMAPQGHITLIDLGCARRLNDDATLDDGSLVGTPAYLAPEVLAGKPPDARSDLYSLGITLFEMLAGRLPWDETDVADVVARKRAGRLPSVRSFAPHVLSHVAQWIARLTAGEPLRRPLSAREAIDELVKMEILTLAQQWR